MQVPVQITFRGMQRSDAVESAVRRRLDHLERFSSELVACHVVVELMQKHKHQGRPFGVRINLTMAGHELVVNRVADEDVYVALRDAFDDMTRQVEDAVRQRRGKEKKHARELHGTVVRINDEAGYGFIQTPDGEEHYFDRENLAGGVRFDQVLVGHEVQFITEVAAEGRQAKRVSMGKHHPATLPPEPPAPPGEED